MNIPKLALYALAAFVVIFIGMQTLVSKKSAPLRECMQLQQKIDEGRETPEDLAKMEECYERFSPEPEIGAVETFGVLGESAQAPAGARAYYTSGPGSKDTITVYDDAIEVYSAMSYPVGNTVIPFSKVMSIHFDGGETIAIRYRNENNQLQEWEFSLFALNAMDPMQGLAENKKLNALLNHLWEQNK